MTFSPAIFHGHAPFVRRLVREHRLAGHVADREDRGLVRAALLVNDDEALVVQANARPAEPGDARIRSSPDRDEHAIEDLFLLFGLAFEADADATLLGGHLHDTCLEQHTLESLRDALGEHVHQISIGARQQARRHFDHRHGAAERRVDGAELEADISAAYDQQRLRDVGQIERRGRIHHAWVVKLQRAWNGRHRPGRENRVFELYLLDAVPGSSRQPDAQVVRVDNLGESL